MHPLDLILKRAGPPCRKVDFIQPRQSRKPGTRELAQWMDAKSIDHHHEAIGQDTAQQETSTQGHIVLDVSRTTG